MELLYQIITKSSFFFVDLIKAWKILIRWPLRTSSIDAFGYWGIMQLRQILFVCWLWTLESKSLFLLFGWKFLRHTPVGNRGVTINKTGTIKVLPKSLRVLLCPWANHTTQTVRNNQEKLEGKGAYQTNLKWLQQFSSYFLSQIGCQKKFIFALQFLLYTSDVWNWTLIWPKFYGTMLHILPGLPLGQKPITSPLKSF